MVEACQVNIAELFFVSQFQKSASLHRSMAVCLLSAKNNFWYNLWAGHLPSLPESFRVLAFPVLLHGAWGRGVARVVGVVSGSRQQQVPGQPLRDAWQVSRGRLWPPVSWLKHIMNIITSLKSEWKNLSNDINLHVECVGHHKLNKIFS